MNLPANLVQVLMVMGREQDALLSAEEAQEKMPNNPAIARWIDRLRKHSPRA